MQVPAVKYAPAGEVSIAYETIGDGPGEIVFVPGFVSHLDLQWDWPFYRRAVELLSAFGRVHFLDKRGTGVSDRSLGFGSAGERMDDIRAVMDDIGIEKASLFGISEGGPLSLLFAATHPDRVERLVLYGTYARLLPGPGYDAPLQVDPEEFARFVADEWGTGKILGLFADHGPEHEQFLARFERSATSPRTAAAVMRSNLMIDVRDSLSTISAPTLVAHQRGDPIVPFWHAEYLAGHIDGAELLELPGAFHVAVDDTHPTAFADALHGFFTGGEPRPPAAQRALTTVLFTDIVDSTIRATAMGDEAWRQLLDRHDRVCRTQIDRHGGELVKSTGDGMLARFDSPGRAVSCARSLRRHVADLDLAVRAGLHTGEVEVRGDDIAGIAVHIAARISGRAGSGEILLSRTVRDLTVGSGPDLDDLGEHDLKGIDERWQLYRVVD